MRQRVYIGTGTVSCAVAATHRTGKAPPVGVGHANCPIHGQEGALVKSSQFAWWEVAFIALEIWVAVLLALGTRRRG